MKKYKIVLTFLLILIFSFFTIWTLINYQKLKRSYSIAIQDYRRLKDDSREMTNYLIKKDSLQFLSEGVKISPSIKLSSLQEGSKIFIKELLDKKESLIVIRFSENHCYSCYGRFFEELKNISPENKRKIVLITDFNNIRDLSIFIKESDFGFDVYNIDNKLDFKIELFDSPYLFLLKNDGSCENFYALDKSHLQVVGQYLQNILK